MADNVVESIQKLIQDVIAPDVRELKVRVEALDKKFDMFQAQMLSSMNELKASVEASTLREVGSLRERVAVLEVQQRSKAA